MIEVEKRQFLDFEKPIKDLYDQIEQPASLPKIKTNMNDAIAMLEERCRKQKQITDNLTPGKVQLSRHPDRPYTLKYIELMCSKLYGAAWRPECERR